MTHLPLPPSVIKAIDACLDKVHPFWTGVSKLKSAAFVWQRTLGKLFKLAEVEGGHAPLPTHFRGEFAAGRGAD